jgi:hypothetical protein
LSAGALRDPAYLPAQIGGIVGAYALSLVLVALLLLALSRTRRQHIRNRDLPEAFLEFDPFPEPYLLQSEEEYKNQLEQFQGEQIQKLTLQTDFPAVRNFSLPSASPLSPTRIGPLSPTKSQYSLFTSHSPTSTILAAGVDLSVDQAIVGRDRAMAQQQLEEMYKHVMEQEQAKAEGREYVAPQLTSPSSNSVGASPMKTGAPKKERNKPSNLNLSRDEKAQSRGSSIFSFLKSPRKNKMQTGGLTISSPIMTPMSGTFPRHDSQEMNAIPPRHYAPAVPPPVPSDLPFRRAAAASSTAGSHHLPTPDISPVSTQSIDSRIDAAAIGQAPSRANARQARDTRLASHSRDVSVATSIGDYDPVSAVSERSTSGLVGNVGLPTSPKPGVNRFPSFDSLPASPRPNQQSFQFHPPPAPSSTTSSRPSAAGNGLTAVREGGALPFRMYDQPALNSPTAPSYATKQTVFTRSAGPLSPGMMTGQRTPWTGAPVPYTPYQPFSPVVPITPSVVTRADRKRMKTTVPKTPTVEMVRDTDDVW